MPERERTGCAKSATGFNKNRHGWSGNGIGCGSRSTAAQLGPQAVAFATILIKQLGLSYGKVGALVQPQYRLVVTRGGLVRMVQRAARQAQPTYAASSDRGELCIRLHAPILRRRD